MAVSALAFTMYPVTDLPRAIAFYEGDLGLKRSAVATDFWTEFDLGENTFGIGTFEQVGKAGTAQSLALEISDLDGFRGALIGKGHSVTEPHDLPTCRIAVVADPDGNQIWLHEAKPR